MPEPENNRELAGYLGGNATLKGSDRCPDTGVGWGCSRQGIGVRTPQISEGLRMSFAQAVMAPKLPQEDMEPQNPTPAPAWQNFI